jgi:D-glycero-D-manno-heptose 1,7-bisphosphate phosphatase
MKVLFLDRDGIVNLDHGYVYKIDYFDFNEGIFKLCLLAQKNNYKIIIVTNQSGIARGYYTENDFNILTKWMINEFKKNDIDILDVLYCPHHEEKGINQYKVACNCRKPMSGMFKEAQRKYNIKLQDSIMIGDKISDVIASNSSGIKSNFLINSKYNSDLKEKNSSSFFVNVSDLNECYSLINTCFN